MPLKCSKCGAELPDGSTVCSKCGTVITLISAEERDRKLKELAMLLEIEEEKPQELEPKITEGPSAVYGKKENGKVGLTNGRVNGLSERTGFTNGRRRGVERRLRPERKKAVIVFGVLLFVVASVLLISFIMPRPFGKIIIDGNFNDWEDVQKTYVSSSAIPHSIAPSELATFIEEKGVSFYVKVKGSIFSGSPQTITERITDGCYILIDSDRNPETGYSALGYGFDYKIGVFGEGGSVKSSSISAYEKGNSRLNWSAWKVISSIDAASSGSQLELQVTKGTVALGNNFIALLIMKSWDGASSEPFLFSLTGVYIEAEVRSVVPLVLGDTPEFLMIDLCAKGGDAILTNLSFERLGTATNYSVFLSDGSVTVGSTNVGDSSKVTIDTESYKLPKDRVITFTLSGNLSGIPKGCTAGFRLASHTSVGATALVLLRSHPANRNLLGYYQEIPDMVVIDGAFGDWKEITRDLNKVGNPNVDIKEYAIFFGRMLGMYLGVEGRIFNGEPVPEKTPVIGTVGGPQPQLGYVSGEDVLRVYLYTSLTYTNPDYMVEISGMDNEIKNGAFYVRTNGDWRMLQPLNAKISFWQLEFEIPNVVKNTFFYVEIEFKDWNNSSVSRLVLSPAVSEEVNFVALSIILLVPIWIVCRRREEKHDRM